MKTIDRPCQFAKYRKELGAIAVEYGLCMLLAGAIMVGVQEIFWEMSIDVLDNFMSWLSKPYP